MQTLSDLRLARPSSLAHGGRAAEQRADDVDRALLELADNTITSNGGIALLAVGGYGRGELSPYSDIDLLILAPRGAAKVDRERLRAFIYPLWDAGWTVGYAVRTPKETIEFAQRDIVATTSILSARLVAGHESTFDALIERRDQWLRRQKRPVLRKLLDGVRRRRLTTERAGWGLAPDLKADTGGLRDAHAVGWIDAICFKAAGDSGSAEDLRPAYETLLAARESLHACVGRSSDRLHMALQAEVAQRLGLEGAGGVDDMMGRVHRAARAIEHATTEAVEQASLRVLEGPRRSGSSAVVIAGVRLDDNVIRFDPNWGPADVGTALRLLAVHAATGKRIAPSSLDALKRVFAGARPQRFEEAHKVAFIELLRGPHADASLEVLDHVDAWSVILPEWLAVRGQPQHDPYHRYTVDGHSFTAVKELTSALAEPIARNHGLAVGELDTLYVATLLHDIGKASGRDHSVAGAEVAQPAASRLGLTEAEAAEVSHMVRYHLLLPDTATRRDLDDTKVIEAVAATVGDERRLRQLYLLAVADGRATGPHGWNDWKASLVGDLVARVLAELEGRGSPTAASPPDERRIDSDGPRDTTARSPGEIARSSRRSPGEIVTHYVSAVPGRSVLTVRSPDRPGTLARVAGVLALNRIAVLAARVHTMADGFALTRVTTSVPGEDRRCRVEAEITAAFSGRLAVDARMPAKIRDYSAGTVPEPEIRVLQDASETSTIVEVRGPDALGLLYAIAAGLADLDLEIHLAKVDTLADRVVDVFYVRAPGGRKLSKSQCDELKRAVTHRIAALWHQKGTSPQVG